jgi:hypothetical protein
MPFCSKHQHAYTKVCTECVVEEHKRLRNDPYELVATPVEGPTTAYRAVLMRCGSPVYTSRETFDTPDAAQRRAAQAFLGQAPGFRH